MFITLQKKPHRIAAEPVEYQELQVMQMKPAPKLYCMKNTGKCLRLSFKGVLHHIFVAYMQLSR